VAMSQWSGIPTIILANRWICNNTNSNQAFNAFNKFLVLVLSVHSVSFCMQRMVDTIEDTRTLSHTIEIYNAKRDDSDIERIVSLLENELETNWWTCKHYRLTPDSTNFVVCHNSGKSIGFVSFWNSRTRLRVTHGYSHIELLAIDTYYQRKGYGRQLLRHVLGYLQKLDMTKTTIHVPKKNLTAKRLYESEGFKFSGEYANHGTILPIYIKMLQKGMVDT